VKFCYKKVSHSSFKKTRGCESGTISEKASDQGGWKGRVGSDYQDWEEERQNGSDSKTTSLTYTLAEREGLRGGGIWKEWLERLNSCEETEGLALEI